MFELFLSILTILTLIIASYTDLKTREVPDWLSYGLIISALSLRFMFSFLLGWTVLITGILGFAACFLLACFLYYTQQWGGGDSKLLMGMGAIVGISYPFSAESFNLIFYISSLFVLGAVYGLFWMMGKALVDRTKFRPEFRRLLQEHNKLQWGFGITSLLLGTAGLFFPPLWLLALFPVMLLYLFLFINATEKSCLLRTVPLQQLEEGDWLVQEVTIRGHVHIPKRTLTAKDIAALKKWAGKQKLTAVLVKDGIPFVPSFLIAYIAFFFQSQVLHVLGRLLV